MRVAVNVFALLGASVVLSVIAPLAPLRAGAEEEAPTPRAKQEGEDQWVPSMAILSGVTVQEWDGSVESEICLGCAIPDPQGRETGLRRSDRGDDRDVTPYMGGNFELMSPALPIPSSPRLFVGGEFAAAFGTDRDVAQEGDPGQLQSPLPDGAEGTTPYGENSVIGQGSTTEAEMDDWIYGAHAGLAFPVEIYGRQLRIKPMFAWMRWEVDVSGLVVDAECAPTINATNCNENLPGGFLREIRMKDSDSETFDGIGPGLDVEMDTGRFGPIGSSLFLGARLYRVLGDTDVKLSAKATFDDQLGQDETAARWSYEVDEWIYRIGLGIRFQWLGTPGPDFDE